MAKCNMIIWTGSQDRGRSLGTKKEKAWALVKIISSSKNLTNYSQILFNISFTIKHGI